MRQRKFNKGKLFNFSRISTVFLVVIMLILSGCAYKPYSLVMHNIGKEDARNAEIIMGARSFSFGWVSPDQRKIQLRPETKLRDRFNAYWTRGDGSEKYNSSLTLPQSLPTLKTKEWYEVVVTINDTNEAAVKVLVCIPPYGPCK